MEQQPPDSGEPLPQEATTNWEQAEAERREFPWFGDATGEGAATSSWIDTPASRAADEAATRELQTEGHSREDAVAAVDERRDRERFERAVALGVNEEDATAALEGHRLLRDARRQRQTQQSKVGRFIAGSALRAEQAQAEVGDEAAGSTPERPRPQPRVWIGSLSDYNAGNLHGEWLDAADDLDRLREGIVGILARSPTPGAEEWAIFDYDDFGPVTDQLGEYESLERVQTIARGIARHGEAFSAYVAALGPLQVDEHTARRFERQFKGEWNSLLQYAAHELQETGAFGVLDEWRTGHVPPDLRPYFVIDLEQYASDRAEQLHVVGHERGVWVFDLNEPTDELEQEQ